MKTNTHNKLQETIEQQRSNFLLNDHLIKKMINGNAYMSL